MRPVREEPTFQTTSEREVWARLGDHVGPDDVLMANVRLTNQDKDFEADLVVLMRMSRATDVLVVVGDPDVIRRVGGEDVARRLGISGEPVQPGPAG